MASSLPHSTLTVIQRQTLAAFVGVAGVYLTGGGALGHVYLGHRRSADLDLFTNDPELLDELAARLVAHCAEHDADLREIQRYPGFRRFEVRAGHDSTLVDLVHDPVPQTVPAHEKPVCDGVHVDSLADIAANKLGALVGRGETKDLVDLYFLDAAGHVLLDYLEAAMQRDGGVSPTTLAFVLRSVPTDTSSLDMVAEIHEHELREFRDRLVAALQQIAWPEIDR